MTITACGVQKVINEVCDSLRHTSLYLSALVTGYSLHQVQDIDACIGWLCIYTANTHLCSNTMHVKVNFSSDDPFKILFNLYYFYLFNFYVCSFIRCFYSKGLTNEKYKRFIIKREIIKIKNISSDEPYLSHTQLYRV